MGNCRSCTLQIVASTHLQQHTLAQLTMATSVVTLLEKLAPMQQYIGSNALCAASFHALFREAAQ